jgi:hypothetical protein
VVLHGITSGDVTATRVVDAVCLSSSTPLRRCVPAQIERVARENNASLVYKPILLGALFREIGTPNAPLFVSGDVVDAAADGARFDVLWMLLLPTCRRHRRRSKRT